MIWHKSHDMSIYFLLKGKKNWLDAMSKVSNCRNCGFVGHLYRDCPHPITSFGIIAYRQTQAHGDPEYLMIQRKDSLSFMEFIRGKYDVGDEAYIKKLMSGMTHFERTLILTSSFEFLWNHVWYQPNIPRLTLEFEIAKSKFQSLQVDNRLYQYISSTYSPYTESERGFPKGRRKIKENDMTCAVREFSEETGFAEGDIRIHQEIPPFEEVFYGTNNVLYKHVYYLAKMIKADSDNPRIDPNNINQAREVRDIQWYNKDQTLANIREYNKERKALFLQVHEIVSKILGSGSKNEA